MNTSINPTLPGERIALLDIIRGFALLGILLMNIEYFQRPLIGMMFGMNTEQVGADYAVAWFSFTFVQGKFYTMFSLLFGLGFMLFLDRAKEKVSWPRFLLFKRLLVLALFGAVHMFLIWGGDILLTYALVGCLLLLFTNTKPSRLWKWAIFFLLIPVVLMWLGAWSISMAANSPQGAEIMADFREDSLMLQADVVTGAAIYAEGTYREVIAWRLHELNTLYGGGGVLFFVPNILGMFLLGAALGRAKIFSNAEQHKGLFKKFIVAGVVIGLPAALVVGTQGLDMKMMIPTYHGAAVFASMLIANVLLCLTYVSVLCLLWLSGKQWLRIFAPAGRMALTNYLVHSIVFTTLFYGYALGMYGEWGRAVTTLMALALYALQLWWSPWWLNRYRYGPCEWLWRSLTYGSLQPMRLKPKNA